MLLIVFVTMINYLDRSAISFAIAPIKRDLHINNEQFGLVASGFGIGYLALSLIAGIVVDRFGAIKTWSLGVLLWSLVTICFSFVDQLATLFIFRILLGIAEAIHFPALLKTVADWLPKKWLARSLSISLLGVPAASLIGAPLLSWTIQHLGWRQMFILLGLIGLTWTLLWTLYFKNKKSSHVNSFSVAFKPGAKQDWKQFFLSLPLLTNCIIYFIFGYIVFFALFWIPGYLEQTFELTLNQVGWATTLPWLFSSIFLLLGGFFSDYLMKRTKSMRISRTYLIAGALFLAAGCFFLVSKSELIESALLFVSLGLGIAFATNAPIFALNADLFPNHAGTAQGIMSSFFALSGFVSPYLTGWMVQLSGNFNSAIFLVSVLSATGGVIALVFQRANKL